MGATGARSDRIGAMLAPRSSSAQCRLPAEDVPHGREAVRQLGATDAACQQRDPHRRRVMPGNADRQRASAELATLLASVPDEGEIPIDRVRELAIRERDEER